MSANKEVNGWKLNLRMMLVPGSDPPDPWRIPLQPSKLFGAPNWTPTCQ
jgi:hypothetical protein